MARHANRRKTRRLPGMKAAAKDLGCDYSHLRRVVLGLRESRSLMRRYTALKADQAKAASATDTTDKSKE